jgi:hypothetical protein
VVVERGLKALVSFFVVMRCFRQVRPCAAAASLSQIPDQDEEKEALGEASFIAELPYLNSFAEQEQGVGAKVKR